MGTLRQATRTVGVAAIVLCVGLALLPFVGVSVLVNPCGGGFYWATPFDNPFLPPNTDPFLGSWAAVVLKRIAYAAFCVVLLAMAAFTSLPFRWVPPLGLAVLGVAFYGGTGRH